MSGGLWDRYFWWVFKAWLQTCSEHQAQSCKLRQYTRGTTSRRNDTGKRAQTPKVDMDAHFDGVFVRTGFMWVVFGKDVSGSPKTKAACMPRPATHNTQRQNPATQMRRQRKGATRCLQPQFWVAFAIMLRVFARIAHLAALPMPTTRCALIKAVHTLPVRLSLLSAVREYHVLGVSVMCCVMTSALCGRRCRCLCVRYVSAHSLRTHRLVMEPDFGTAEGFLISGQGAPRCVGSQCPISTTVELVGGAVHVHRILRMVGGGLVAIHTAPVAIVRFAHRAPVLVATTGRRPRQKRCGQISHRWIDICSIVYVDGTV